MSKPAEPSFFSRPRIIRLFFFIMIGCLAIHFLVEDSFLLALYERLDPAAASASHLFSEEFDHLDDLAYATSLPASNLSFAGVAAFLWSTSFIRQAHLPIFKPPK